MTLCPVNPIQPQSPQRTVAVDVVDPDLDADVRAVLAALSLVPCPTGGAPADVVVTDRAEVAATAGPMRVLRVAADGAGVDDDEAVHLPSGTARLVASLSAPVESASGRLVAVVGAVGGCGTSTVAAALAIRATTTSRTLLVEADPLGAGLDLLLGTESESGLRVEDIRSELGGPDPEALWTAVPEVAPGCGLLARARDRGGAPRVGDSSAVGDGALGATLAHRAGGGLVVCDVGRFSADDPVLGRADLVVVVTGADLAGAVAATAVTDGERGLGGRDGLQMVVRTHRGDPLHAADVAAAAGVDRWHVVPEIAAARGLAGSGALAASLTRGRSGRARRLAAVADAVLAGGGL